jgi:hypothetical protein
MRGRSIFFLPGLLFPALLLGAQQVSFDLSTVDDLVRAGIANNIDLAAVRERILCPAHSHALQAGCSHRVNPQSWQEFTNMRGPTALRAPDSRALSQQIDPPGFAKGFSNPVS